MRYDAERYMHDPKYALAYEQSQARILQYLIAIVIGLVIVALFFVGD